jgi:hypothetical protein
VRGLLHVINIMTIVIHTSKDRYINLIVKDIIYSFLNK